MICLIATGEPSEAAFRFDDGVQHNAQCFHPSTGAAIAWTEAWPAQPARHRPFTVFESTGHSAGTALWGPRGASNAPYASKQASKQAKPTAIQSEHTHVYSGIS